jgi:hypothetical protein
MRTVQIDKVVPPFDVSSLDLLHFASARPQGQRFQIKRQDASAPDETVACSRRFITHIKYDIRILRIYKGGG